MKLHFRALLVALVLPVSTEAVDYVSDVLPIMKEHCWKCHSNENQVKGNLALDDLEEVRDYQIGKFNIIRPGNPEESNFLEVMKLDASHSDFMPRKADPVPDREIAVIESWIKSGAVIDAKNPVEEEKEWLVGGASSDGEMPENVYLNWTSSDGKSIEARFHSLSGDSVKIVMKDGRSFTIPFSRLDALSIEQARKLAGSGS
ncbi:MAG: c-type cytochrome domain-containing protein [Verrucomicrobiota bacterium]|nr:c-type cytochrome domain-containing protein [Verrucomicrobiota bacterium]